MIISLVNNLVKEISNSTKSPLKYKSLQKYVLDINSYLDSLDILQRCKGLMWPQAWMIYALKQGQK